jgi:hypothetical protein
MAGLLMLLHEDPWDDIEQVDPDFFPSEVEPSARGFGAPACAQARDHDDLDEIPPEERMRAPSWARPLALK